MSNLASREKLWQTVWGTDRTNTRDQHGEHAHVKILTYNRSRTTDPPSDAALELT